MFSEYFGNCLDSWGFGQKDASLKEKISQHQERHFELVRSYQKLCQDSYNQLLSASIKGDFTEVKEAHKAFLQGLNQNLEAIFENNIALASLAPERLGKVINFHRDVYAKLLDKFPATKEISSQMKKHYLTKGVRKLALSSMSAVVASMIIPSAGMSTAHEPISLSQDVRSPGVGRVAPVAVVNEAELPVLQEQLQYRSYPQHFDGLTHVISSHLYSAEQTAPSQLNASNYPKCTFLHPYQPRDGERIGEGIAHVPLVMYLSAVYQENLPNMIKNKLAQEGIAPQNMKITVCAQNFPWHDGTQISLRPHYATDPNAPTYGIYDVQRQIEAGIFSSTNDSISLSDFVLRPGGDSNRIEDYNVVDKPVNTFNPFGVHVHPADENPTEASEVLLSHVAPIVKGVSTRGQSFWSYVSYLNDEGQRTALMTLHLLVNDQQCNALQAALEEELPRGGNELQKMLNVVNRLQVTPSFNDGEGHVEKLAHLMGFVSPKLSYNIAASDNTGIELAQPGFSGAEGTHRWTKERQATMVVPIGPDARTLSFADTGAFLPGAHVQRVGLTINGNGVGDYIYDAQHPSHTIKTVLQPGIDVAFCEFNIQNPISPQAVGMSADDRALGIQFKSVEVGTPYRIGAKAQHNLGEDRVFPYHLVEGFSGPEGAHRWTLGNKAVIEIPLAADVNQRPHSITFYNTSGLVLGGYSQTVNVKLNGELVSQYKYTAENNSQIIDIKIPLNIANVARIEFEMLNPTSARALGIGDDDRMLGILFRQVELGFTR